MEIRLQDYRDVSDGPFDAISSIGMFEHVGAAPHARSTSTDLYRLLAPPGRLLNHAISRPSPAARPAVDPRSFMGRYVFPDSALMEVGAVVSAMQRIGFEVRDVQSLREHYARTLHAWSANLDAHWDEAQTEVGPGRARVWRLYLRRPPSASRRTARRSTRCSLCALTHAATAPCRRPERAWTSPLTDA